MSHSLLHIDVDDNFRAGYQKLCSIKFSPVDMINIFHRQVSCEGSLRKNSINAAHFKQKILVAQTYPSQESC